MRPNIVPTLGVLLASLLSSAPGRADTLDACVHAAEEGQSLRDQGKLLAARERFLACSRDACPRVVRADCAGWLGDLDARLPSVVLAAADEAGRDLVDVQISIDGAPCSEGVTGRSIPLDPGLHRFRFVRPSGAAVEETVLLREGERARRVAARFAPPRAAPPPSPRGSTPTRGAVIAALALGGVAVSGAGVFAGLATVAKNEVGHLRATCAPGCTEAQVDAVRAKEIGANVALGVGLAAAVTAALVLVVGPTEPKAPPAGAWIAPQRGGGMIGIGASF